VRRDDEQYRASKLPKTKVIKSLNIVLEGIDADSVFKQRDLLRVQLSLDACCKQLPIPYRGLVDAKVVEGLTEATRYCIFALLTVDNAKGNSLAEESVQLLAKKLIRILSLCGVVKTLVTNRRKLKEVTNDDNVNTGKRFIVSTTRDDLTETPMDPRQLSQRDHRLFINDNVLDGSELLLKNVEVTRRQWLVCLILNWQSKKRMKGTTAEVARGDACRGCSEDRR
jgi:hypothetical protein